MPYKLHHGSTTIARAANTTAYGTFTLISSADSSGFAIPIKAPSAKIINLIGLSVWFNWALAPSANSIRVYLAEAPIPAVTDGVSNNSFTYAGLTQYYLGKFFFSTVNDGAGFSYGYVNVNPIPIANNTPALYATMETSTGITNPPSGGLIKLAAHFEESM